MRQALSLSLLVLTQVVISFMEYVSGGTIGSLLTDGQFNKKLTQSYTVQILYGLEYLHAKIGIIHRVS